MTNARCGVPKGKNNNPKGANQYAPGKGLGEKDSRVEVRLSAEQKRILKEAAQKEGMSLSSWMLEAALKAVSL